MRSDQHRQALSKSLNRFYTTGLKVDIKTVKLRKIWNAMKRRCFCKKDPAFFRYGGRGITVCDRWLVFDNFLEDVEIDYRYGLTLDRIDNNGNYELDNIRWTTRKVQAINRRNTKFFAYDGKTMTLSDWARYLNVPRSRLSMRFYVYKWPLERVLS